MTDVRRFDLIEKVVRDMRRQLDDAIATIMPRFSSHVHGSGVEARYHHTTTQSIPNLTDTKIKFNTAITTTTDVVASGVGNTDFALNRAGLWRVSAGLRYNASAGGNERHIFGQTGTVFNTANRFMSLAIANDDVADGPITIACSTDIRVTAGTSICIGAWQNTGVAVGTDVGFGGTAHLALTWLRP